MARSSKSLVGLGLVALVVGVAASNLFAVTAYTCYKTVGVSYYYFTNAAGSTCYHTCFANAGGALSECDCGSQAKECKSILTTVTCQLGKIKPGPNGTLVCDMQNNDTKEINVNNKVLSGTCINPPTCP